MQLLRVTELSQLELEQVINLHYQVLHESFINNFGLDFLRIAYKTPVESKNNITIIAKESSKISGFLVAAINGDKFNQEVIQKNFLSLSWQIIKTSILKPVLLIKLAQWKLKPTHEHEVKPELQFIAINPKFQGRGLGTKMLQMLSKEFKKEGIDQYRVGTKAQNIKSNNFYQKLGFKPYYTDNFFGDDFNYYLSPNIK